MFKKIAAYSLLSCLSLTLGSPAFAQTLNATPPAAEEAPAPTANAADAAQVFGLWTVRCMDATSCVASTSLARTDANGNPQRVAEVRIASRGNDRTIAFQSQPGVLIRPGVEIKVGEQTARLQYLLCTPGSCLARALLSDELYDAIKSGDVMNVTVALPPSQGNPARGVTFDIALDGSSAALNAIESHKQ